jgi:hypothetical protein
MNAAAQQRDLSNNPARRNGSLGCRLPFEPCNGRHDCQYDCLRRGER